MYSQLTLIKKLSDLGERQLGQEVLASKLLISELEKFKVKYKVQYFATKIPLVKSVSLAADRKKIQAKSTSLVSGLIKNKFQILTPLIGSAKKNQVNINYNPKCADISRSDFFFKPSVAVNKKDIAKIKKARYVEAKINVKAQPHRSLNILIGNQKNPKHILFAHYDSIGPGAVDDASGIAILMRLIVDYPKLEKENLFVLSGNEELSYDVPYYWGRGYRAFEQKFPELLKQAKKIIIVEGLGATAPLVSRKLEIVRPCFPIRQMKKYRPKTQVIYGSFDFLNTVYHSDLDLPVNVKQQFLNQANRKILMIIE